MSITPAAITLRPYTPADEAAVLGLVNADRLPGQPVATAAMLAEATAGRSRVDTAWWAELATPVTLIAADIHGAVKGVISYALRGKDDTGVILWLHCHEDENVAAALLGRVVSEFGGRTLHAFHFATALSLGLEALPVGHRPATRRALEQHGFAGENLWRYMRAELPVAGLPHVESYRTDAPTPDTRRLTVTDEGRLVAEATIGTPFHGTGVLWWIGVEPAARREGLGRALLGSALDLMTGLGGTEVILFVDDDAPSGDDRDRAAANRLYESAGFEEIDRLHSFTR
ncbi:GNAT family N-acetyltransferase [Streptomyces mauvecolor]